jgi:hypothetical protein
VVLDDSNILQADATVIAGILILLTVTYILAPRSKQEVVGEIAVSTVIKISQVAIFVVTIFSTSAILVVLGNMLGSYTNRLRKICNDDWIRSLGNWH